MADEVAEGDDGDAEGEGVTESIEIEAEAALKGGLLPEPPQKPGHHR